MAAKQRSTEEPIEDPSKKKAGPIGTEADSVTIAGVLKIARKLLDQIPPELRDKVIEQAKTHGPDAALVAVNAAAGKARGLKTRMALKALSVILTALVKKSNPP